MKHLDFIVTGLPGTGSCFWSFALTQGTTSFCSHEHDADIDPPLPAADFIGDVSASYLSTPKPTNKRVLILRDQEDAMKSYLSRYPTSDVSAVREQFNDLAEKANKLRFKPAVLVIDYESRFSEETIRKVFLHCTGRQIHAHRLNLLTKTQILKHE